jgi:cell division septation protein DedD
VSERDSSGSAGRRRRGPGLLSALAGASLLVALGFALGVVAGLVLEEPDLLLDYVAGRTTTVAVSEGEARPPDVAASPPPAPTTAGTPEIGHAGTPGTEPAGGPSSAPSAEATDPGTPIARAEPSEAPARGFAVQVGAFADARAAEQLVRRLKGRGLPVYVAPSTGTEAPWRVRVGPLGTREEADQMARRLEQEERLGTWVLAESPL